MLAAALLAASLALTATQSKAIDRVVTHVMQADHIAGLSLGIALKDRHLLLRGYGVREIATAARPDGYTIYRIGSITKQFTAALVLQEVERGRLSLDASTNGGITIAQLLSQTSGLASYTDPGMTLDAALRAPVQFQPGSAWQYSNTNYYLLGLMLQSAEHEPYAALLQSRIIAPLHLRSTSFALARATNAALGYRWEDSRYVAAPLYENDMPELAFSAGALSSNVVDLLQWLEALRSGGVIAPADFKRMTTSWKLPDGVPTHYGFGFFIDEWYGRPIAHHTGFLDGFSSIDAIGLDDGLEMVILSNADREDLIPLAKSVVAIVEGAKETGLVAGFAHPPENEDPAVTALVKTVVAQLAHGTLDRALLTPSFAATMSETRLRSYAAILGPLGTLKLTEFLERDAVNAGTYEKYRLTFASAQYLMTMGYRNGKIDALSLEPVH